MSWARFDDRFLMNPKIMQAGLEARALYIASILYSAGELTDGFVAEGVVLKLAALSDVPDSERATDKLVDLGLWEQAVGGYLIHDYLDYNPTRQRVIATKEARAEAGSEGGKQKASNLLEASQGGASEMSLQSSSKSLPRTRTPSPLTISTEVEIGESAPAKPKARSSGGVTLPPDFVITDDLLDWATAKSMDYDVYINPILLAEKFISYYREGKGRTKRQLDWPATWHQWVLSEIEKGGHKGGRNGQAPPGVRMGPANVPKAITDPDVADKYKPGGKYSFLTQPRRRKGSEA